MTAIDQLSAWAADPKTEIFVGASYAEKPFVVDRVAAGLVVERFARMAGPYLASATVETINGVTCVLVTGETPAEPHAKYRVILAPVETFL